MNRGFFITATGTDVGKTVATAGVLRWMVRRGLSCMMMKPVQTGAEPDESGRLQASDISTVLAAVGNDFVPAPPEYIAPYCFRPACSPHLAARLAGTPIVMETILERFQWLQGRYDSVMVEGAGGLMVPLNDHDTMLDLMRRLGLPVLLVAHSGLGSINHTLLSVEALRRRNLPIHGILLNDRDEIAVADAFIHDDTAATIAAMSGVPVLARLPHLGTPPDWARLDEVLDTVDFS